MPTYTCRSCGSTDIEVSRSTWQRSTTLLTPGEMFELHTRGFSLHEIGAAAGISHQGVSSSLNHHYPGWRDVSLAIREEAALLDAFARRAERATPCVVCGCWVLRGHGGNKTCSQECAVVWKTSSARYQLDSDEHEKHRIRVARVYLKSPQRYKPSNVAWAKRVIAAVEAGEPIPPPNRRFRVRGSVATNATAPFIRDGAVA